MDRRERACTEEETLRAAFESMQAGMWTALPGILQSFNAGAMTAVVQPSIKGRVTDKLGNATFINIPQCLDVPIIFPAGGGYTLTFPMVEGDEGLLVFSSRCIDAWWQNGGIQVPIDLRMHDLSDGFFIPGAFSQPRVISDISTNTTQLRNNAGDTFVEIAGGGVVNINAPTLINLNAPIVRVQGIIQVINENSVPSSCAINGAITATGNITAGEGTTNIDLLTHVHANGGGIGNSGEPVG